MLPIRDVSDSQILDVATAKPRAIVTPIRPKRPTLGDLITQSFFAAGAEQEASGVYHETEHVKIRSLDHVPRRWWPTMIALCLVLGAATAGAWYLGFRPPATWQTSRAWQALHLPSMPPPAHPRWML